MNLTLLKEGELVKLREDLQALHTGSSNKIFTLGEKGNMTMYACVDIADKRLSDLLFTLFTEVHNELCDRFKNKIGKQV